MSLGNTLSKAANSTLKTAKDNPALTIALLSLLAPKVASKLAQAYTLVVTAKAARDAVG